MLLFPLPCLRTFRSPGNGFWLTVAVVMRKKRLSQSLIEKVVLCISLFAFPRNVCVTAVSPSMCPLLGKLALFPWKMFILTIMIKQNNYFIYIQENIFISQSVEHIIYYKFAFIYPSFVSHSLSLRSEVRFKCSFNVHELYSKSSSYLLAEHLFFK